MSVGCYTFGSVYITYRDHEMGKFWLQQLKYFKSFGKSRKKRIDTYTYYTFTSLIKEVKKNF